MSRDTERKVDLVKLKVKARFRSCLLLMLAMLSCGMLLCDTSVQADTTNGANVSLSGGNSGGNGSVNTVGYGVRISFIDYSTLQDVVPFNSKDSKDKKVQTHNVKGVKKTVEALRNLPCICINFNLDGSFKDDISQGNMYMSNASYGLKAEKYNAPVFYRQGVIVVNKKNKKAFNNIYKNWGKYCQKQFKNTYDKLDNDDISYDINTIAEFKDLAIKNGSSGYKNTLNCKVLSDNMDDLWKQQYAPGLYYGKTRENLALRYFKFMKKYTVGNNAGTWKPIKQMCKMVFGKGYKSPEVYAKNWAYEKGGIKEGKILIEPYQLIKQSGNKYVGLTFNQMLVYRWVHDNRGNVIASKFHSAFGNNVSAECGADGFSMVNSLGGFERRVGSRLVGLDGLTSDFKQDRIKMHKNTYNKSNPTATNKRCTGYSSRAVLTALAKLEADNCGTTFTGSYMKDIAPLCDHESNGTYESNMAGKLPAFTTQVAKNKLGVKIGTYWCLGFGTYGTYLRWNDTPNSAKGAAANVAVKATYDSLGKYKVTKKLSNYDGVDGEPESANTAITVNKNGTSTLNKGINYYDRYGLASAENAAITCNPKRVIDANVSAPAGEAAWYKKHVMYSVAKFKIGYRSAGLTDESEEAGATITYNQLSTNVNNNLPDTLSAKKVVINDSQAACGGVFYKFGWGEGNNQGFSLSDADWIANKVYVRTSLQDRTGSAKATKQIGEGSEDGDYKYATDESYKTAVNYDPSLKDLHEAMNENADTRAQQRYSYVMNNLLIPAINESEVENLQIGTPTAEEEADIPQDVSDEYNEDMSSEDDDIDDSSSNTVEYDDDDGKLTGASVSEPLTPKKKNDSTQNVGLTVEALRDTKAVESYVTFASIVYNENGEMTTATGANPSSFPPLTIESSGIKFTGVEGTTPKKTKYNIETYGEFDLGQLYKDYSLSRIYVIGIPRGAKTASDRLVNTDTSDSYAKKIWKNVFKKAYDLSSARASSWRPIKGKDILESMPAEVQKYKNSNEVVSSSYRSAVRIFTGTSSYDWKAKEGGENDLGYDWYVLNIKLPKNLNINSAVDLLDYQLNYIYPSTFVDWWDGEPDVDGVTKAAPGEAYTANTTKHIEDVVAAGAVSEAGEAGFTTGDKMPEKNMGSLTNGSYWGSSSETNWLYVVKKDKTNKDKTSMNARNGTTDYKRTGLAWAHSCCHSSDYPDYSTSLTNTGDEYISGEGSGSKTGNWLAIAYKKNDTDEKDLTKGADKTKAKYGEGGKTVTLSNKLGNEEKHDVLYSMLEASGFSKFCIRPIFLGTDPEGQLSWTDNGDSGTEKGYKFLANDSKYHANYGYNLARGNYGDKRTISCLSVNDPFQGSLGGTVVKDYVTDSSAGGKRLIKQAGVNYTESGRKGLFPAQENICYRPSGDEADFEQASNTKHKITQASEPDGSGGIGVVDDDFEANHLRYSGHRHYVTDSRQEVNNEGNTYEYRSDVVVYGSRWMMPTIKSTGSPGYYSPGKLSKDNFKASDTKTCHKVWISTGNGTGYWHYKYDTYLMYKYVYHDTTPQYAKAEECDVYSVTNIIKDIIFRYHTNFSLQTDGGWKITDDVGLPDTINAVEDITALRHETMRSKDDVVVGFNSHAKSEMGDEMKEQRGSTLDHELIKTETSGINENDMVKSYFPDVISYRATVVNTSNKVVTYYPELEMIAVDNPLGKEFENCVTGIVKTISEAPRRTQLSSMYFMRITYDDNNVAKSNNFEGGKQALTGTIFSDTMGGGTLSGDASDTEGNEKAVIYGGSDVTINAKGNFNLNMYGYALDLVGSYEDDETSASMTGQSASGTSYEGYEGGNTVYKDIVNDESAFSGNKYQTPFTLWNTTSMTGDTDGKAKGYSFKALSTQFSNWVRDIRENLYADMTLKVTDKNNNDTFYNNFNVSLAELGGGKVDVYEGTYPIVVKEGSIDYGAFGYQNLIKQIARDYYNKPVSKGVDPSADEIKKAQEMFQKSDIWQTIQRSIEDCADDFNNSQSATEEGCGTVGNYNRLHHYEKWYDEQVKTFVIRRFVADPTTIDNVILSDKIDYGMVPESKGDEYNDAAQEEYDRFDGRWYMTLYLKNGYETTKTNAAERIMYPYLSDQVIYDPRLGRDERPDSVSYSQNKADAIDSMDILINELHVANADFILPSAVQDDINY